MLGSTVGAARGRVRRWSGRVPVAALLLCAAACGGRGAPSDADLGPSEESDAPAGIPARGDSATFDVATWNLNWFGDPGNGPDDEALQQGNVRDVMAAADLDLWALQEVVDEAAFARLVAALPGYDGLLADAPSVVGGAEWYEDFGDREQKVALVYRSSLVTVRGARIVLTRENHAFAGRPPMEVEVTLSLGGATVDGVILLLHAKASPDEESLDRRLAASLALEAYLDSTWPTVPVWVLGDFNDDVDTSIRVGSPSPYANFVDAPDWSFPTVVLSQQGVSSTVDYPDVVDHHLVSDEAAGGYVTGSVEAFRVDRWVPSYGATTTDHYPVLARYTLQPAR